MMSATGKSAQQVLDEVHRMAQLEEFSVERYGDRLAAELTQHPATTLADLEAHDQRLRAGLAAIDGFASKSMRIHLDHRLAGDTSVAGPFRTYLASSVIGYDGDLELLRQRVAGSAARHDPGGAATTADTIVDAARAVLATRTALRDQVFGLARTLAAAAIPVALAAARDHGQADADRLRWSAARRDLALVVEDPRRVGAQRFADRCQGLPVVDEPPEAAPALTREELIELY